MKRECTVAAQPTEAECDDCDGSGTYYIDGKPQTCICIGEQPMNFSMALTALKNGDRVSRSGWNGKGMWIQIQHPDGGSKMTLPYIFMRTAGEIGDLVPWLASQTDILADDWDLVVP